jgi:hypothetical protein
MGRLYSEVIKEMSVRRGSRGDLLNRKNVPCAYSLAAAMLMSVLLPVLHASAFTIDSASGSTPDGSPRFVDPDEQVHSFFSGGSALNEDGWANQSAVSRNASPAPDGTNQGITFPNWFFPTSPPR